jgi:hypothetical protein
MEATILEQLKADFPRVMEKPGGGGRTFKYIPSEDIFSRMNEVFLGNWSTQVISQEIIDDQVLIRVSVSVSDPYSEERIFFIQEGFASQPIARYNRGDKSGQIIDIGNSYMAAMTKAIKQAVKKWGVALYIEGSSESSNFTTSSPSNSTPPPPATSMTSALADSSGPTSASVPPTSPAGSNPFVDGGMNKPEVEQFVEPSNGAFPPPPPANTPPVEAPPVEASASSLPPTPAPMEERPTNPVVNDNQQPLEAPAPRGTITDVQKIALNGILGLKDIGYNDLVVAAFTQKGIQKDEVPELDKLSFEEAAAVIKYGNDLYRKSK